MNEMTDKQLAVLLQMILSRLATEIDELNDALEEVETREEKQLFGHRTITQKRYIGAKTLLPGLDFNPASWEEFEVDDGLILLDGLRELHDELAARVDDLLAPPIASSE